MKTILLMLCLLPSAFGQTVQITDGSPSDSPIKFKGTVTFGPANSDATCMITGHNNGDRAIVAYVALLEVIRADGHHFALPFTHDHFFKDAATLAMVAPQSRSDFDANFRCADFGHSDGNYAATPRPPSMTITATFVQFDDGSMWGEPVAAKELAFQRMEAITYLQSLKASGNFTQALSQAPPLTGEDHRLRWERALTWAGVSEQPDSQAQADEINKRLAIAQAHEVWIATLTAQ